MAVLAAIIAAAVCLAVGLITEKIWLSLAALGFSLVGLAALGVLLARARRAGDNPLPAAEGPDAVLSVPTVKYEPASEAKDHDCGPGVHEAEKCAANELRNETVGGEGRTSVLAGSHAELDSSAEAGVSTADSGLESIDHRRGDADRTGGIPGTQRDSRESAQPDQETSRPGVLAIEESGLLSPEQSRLVRVIPGRRRFHVEGCRLLPGHKSDQIELSEALDEGFSACTACILDREMLIARW
jgi:hypothetical protein